MSAPAKTPIVERHYIPSPDACARAMSVLLTDKKAAEGAHPGGRDYAEEIRIDCAAERSIPRP